MLKRIFVLLLFIIPITAQQKELTVKDIYSNPALYPSQGYSGAKWANDGSILYYYKANQYRAIDIYQLDPVTGEESIYVNSADLKTTDQDALYRIRNWEVLPGGKKILFTDILPARKTKSGGNFYLYDIQLKKFELIAQSELEQVNATISPDAKKIAFVRGNNIFVYDIDTKKEKQITFDSNPEVINGKFDWVYEEEFSIINGIKWSADSKYIAYWKLDQTPIPSLQIQTWEDLHTGTFTMRYPKAGDPNSIVNINVADVNSGSITKADIGTETDIYIPRIEFGYNNNLMIFRLNRLQNKLDLLETDIKNGNSKVILTEQDEAWIDIEDNYYFSSKKNFFIWWSEKDGFAHLYKYDYTGKQLAQLTSGSYEVTGLSLVDEVNSKIYYTTNERSIYRTDLYSITLDGKDKKRVNDKDGVHKFSMSPNGKLYIDRISTINLENSSAIYSTTGKKIKDITVFKGLPSEYELGRFEFMNYKLSDGTVLNGAILKPVDFDSTKKYPVMLSVYGGPGSQHVTDNYSPYDYYFSQLLAQKGYITIGIDNRGTKGRGSKFKKQVYKDVGKYNSEDMIETAKYLSTLPYIDKNRIGVFGWSYGGYYAALSLAKAGDYIKTAVAVAPVTDWRFYDNIYTERFMSTPQLNLEGYRNSSVVENSAGIKGNLLLIHGTADDNVHFQNTVILVESMVENDVKFDVMFYPEKDHGIYGGNTRIHLFEKITNYLLEKL